MSASGRAPKRVWKLTEGEEAAKYSMEGRGFIRRLRDKVCKGRQKAAAATEKDVFSTERTELSIGIRGLSFYEVPKTNWSLSAKRAKRTQNRG
jgi:hypothetical protein